MSKDSLTKAVDRLHGLKTLAYSLEGELLHTVREMDESAQRAFDLLYILIEQIEMTEADTLKIAEED